MLDMYHRRYVEYSDYFLHLGISGDRIPPGIDFKWI